MAKLILHTEDGSKEFALNGSATIGRQSSNTVQINEPKASRSHARITCENGAYFVEDLESSNGTRVNGKKVEKGPLYHGDTIQIGVTRLVFDEPSAKRQAAKDKPPAASSSKSTREIKAHAQKEDTTDPLCGKEFGGYRIVSRLGQGGMGTVYRAKQLSMDREVALKVMKPDLSQNREFVKGFLKEARMAGQLTHPAIVQVHDVGEAAGTLYFSMEIVEGESVYSMLKREGRIGIAKALDIAVAVCEALAHAQRHRIVHQDIKPHNIMVDKRGLVKVADLGLAASAGRDKNAEKRANVLMGTPHYMAPEQSQKREIDTRTDIYALGATIFHMLTGRVPFDGPTSLVVITKHITQERVDPRQYDVTIPARLAETVMEMMAVAMDKRPGDPKELADRLRGIKDDYLQAVEDAGRKKGKGQGVIKKRATLNEMASVKPSIVESEIQAREERAVEVERKREAASAAAADAAGREWAKVGLGAAVLAIGLLVVYMFSGSILNALKDPVEQKAPPKPVKADTEPAADPQDPWKTAAKTTPAKPAQPSESKTAASPGPDAEGQSLAELHKAREARDRALQSGNFAGARQALQRLRDTHRVGAVGDEATKELRETEKVIAETLERMFQSAEKSANDKNYRAAAAQCTRLISADPMGSYAKKASALMQRLDQEGEAPFKQVMGQADKALTQNRIDEAMKALGAGLDTLAGTKWAEPLGARQLQLVFANKLLKSMERARQQRAEQAKPTEVKVTDTGDKKVAGILREVTGLVLSAEIGGAGFKYPLAKMTPDELYQLVEVLGQSGDHLGLANLLLLLKHETQARAEIDRAMKVQEQSAEAARLAAKLSGVSNLHVYDFSKWQHQSDWDAPSGAWSTKDDRYVLESPEGGDTALKTDAIGGPFAARNARVAFEFVLDAAKAGEGWFLAMEFGTEQRNVTVLFSAEGYRLQSNLGEMTQVKGEWKPAGGTPVAVELEFKDNTVAVILNGKKGGETLNATGLSELKGTVAFHIRETTCALDNIALRNVE